MARRSGIWTLAAFALLLGVQPVAALTRHVTVLAASSMARPMDDILAAYAMRSTDKIRGIYGASGTLARQIEAGAPADIYIAAQPEWMDYLRARHQVRDDTIRALAGNRLALIGGLGVKLPNDVRRALEQVRPRRIGMADPATVGSGHYAMQTLQALRLWDSIQPDLLLTENDPAVFGLVERGEIPVGFAYATDAYGLDRLHVVALVDDTLHDRIVYSAGIVTGSDVEPAVRDFFTYLTGPDAAQILRKRGFLQPAPSAGAAEPKR